jgi:hypothetical protein
MAGARIYLDASEPRAGRVRSIKMLSQYKKKGGIAEYTTERTPAAIVSQQMPAGLELRIRLRNGPLRVPPAGFEPAA